MKELIQVAKQDRQNLEKDACKGLVFRGYLNSYGSEYSGKLCQKVELRLLKRSSCKGCQWCGWFWDYISDEIENLINFDGVENDKIYEPIPVISREWESGIDELDYIEFKEIKKPHK